MSETFKTSTLKESFSVSPGHFCGLLWSTAAHWRFFFSPSVLFHQINVKSVPYHMCFVITSLEITMGSCNLNFLKTETQLKVRAEHFLMLHNTKIYTVIRSDTWKGAGRSQRLHSRLEIRCRKFMNKVQTGKPLTSRAESKLKKMPASQKQNWHTDLEKPQSTQRCTMTKSLG